MSCECIDVASIQSVPLQSSPFPYAIIPHALKKACLNDIQRDFPVIQDAGSFPLTTLHYGGAFAQLMTELQSDEFRALMAEKFSMDLSDKPVMITVRGKADEQDGRIHRDSKSKLITVLLYMNEEWQPDGGRLRLLHDKHNLDNYFAEIPPTEGSMLIFKVTDNGWHGHKTFIGTRKVLQLNYVTDAHALNRHALRHRLSAKLKAWKRKIFHTE